MDRLLELGANVNAATLSGTALPAAVNNGNTETIYRLLLAGADISTRIDCIGYCLKIAAKSGHESLVKLLLGRGTTIQMLGTALLDVVYKGFISIFIELLNAGADPNVSDREGFTPLHAAVFTRNLPMLRTLLKGPLRFKIESFNQVRTPKDCIRVKVDAVTLLYQHTPLHEAVNIGWEEGINELIHLGANPQTPDVHRLTCLDWSFPHSNVFSKMRHNRSTFVPTPMSVQRTIMQESVVILADLLMQNPNGFRHSDVDAYCVFRAPFWGRCLLRLLDFEEASTYFQQQIDKTSRFADKETLHCGVVCDGRKQTPISGSRFVCYSCFDVDLCSLCIGKDGCAVPDPRC